MLLDLARDVIRSVACFGLRAHTLRIETVTCQVTCQVSPVDSQYLPYMKLVHC